MQLGLHAYVQKPLAHDIYECRRLTEVARDRKLITQMGIQIHSNAEYRLGVRLIQDGVIGKIREVHTFSDKNWGDANPGPTARIRCRRRSTGTGGSAWPRPAITFPSIIIPANGGAGSTSAPAPSATWAAIFTIRSLRLSP